MKTGAIAIIILITLITISCTAKLGKAGNGDQGSYIKFVPQESDKRMDIMIDGKLFTSYWWPDSVYKPVLYPILTAAGTPVTRGFPIKPREGERRDHIHQVGNWFNYGNVNGYDFWGNGSEGKRNVNGGQIKHKSIGQLSGGKGEGSFVTTASWIDPSGKELLAETTEFHFIANGSTRIIDRVATLTSSGEPVSFKDTKEGSFGIRVARELELPSKEDIVLTDARGNPTTVKKMSNEGVNGNYKSSEGVTGEAVWGKRAKWMDLYGSVGNEKVSLVICDHPKNLSYPTYWHARGYGLMAANAFGAKDFTAGKEELNYKIPAGGSLKMRYRIIVTSGTHLSDTEINAYADDFAKKYQ
ncbi:MAG: PmoA family protein [Chitinophagaceae bacterium]